MPCIHTIGPSDSQRPCKPTAENPFVCAHTGPSGHTHSVKCAIQWIDEIGNPTPDYNEAIGVCYIESYTDGYERTWPEGRHFPICSEHAKRFDTRREQMSRAHWKLIPLAQYALQWCADCESNVGPGHECVESDAAFATRILEAMPDGHVFSAEDLGNASGAEVDAIAEKYNLRRHGT